MRKTRVLALVVASLVSTASFAGAQAPAASPPDSHAMAHKHKMKGHRRAEHGRLLRGLKLSDAEKAKVKEIRARYAVEARALHQGMKAEMKEARALRQKGDTAGLRALREKNKDVREKMLALHNREQAEIRAALSPENQKLFDAKLEKWKQKREEKREAGKKHEHGALRTRGAARIG